MADEATTESTPTTETPAVEFDGEFSEDRAKRKIAGLAQDKAKLQERLAKFEREAQARADAEKSDLEKLAERLQRAEATIAERDKASARDKLVKTVREKHGLPESDAMFLTGDTEEELEARASALAARLGAKKDATAEVPGKPKAQLTPGHQATGDGAGSLGDPNAIAERIYNRLR